MMQTCEVWIKGTAPLVVNHYGNIGAVGSWLIYDKEKKLEGKSVDEILKLKGIK